MGRAWGCLFVCVAMGACDSPEAHRTRGGGPGGDLRNRPVVVEMHAGSQQYWETPTLIPAAAEAPSLEPARHAQRAGRAE